MLSPHDGSGVSPLRHAISPPTPWLNRSAGDSNGGDAIKQTIGLILSK
jgi:hypothetical protein